ncbi:hypothetical protein ABZU32_32475 [Sphaerisporangium sp. NPDC005288]|uniref:hypothetical protein n=1 Tax=Sphaerisporangium sp. NPDC005288 TaxID=3155114 RepID=UPI0033A59B71
MTLLTSPKHDRWAALTALTAGASSWQSTALMAGALAAWTAMRLLTEWQMRRTLVALARTARSGRITIPGNAPPGHALRLSWGADHDSDRRPRRTGR